MSLHTSSFTMPTQSQMMDVRARIGRNLHQLRGTSHHQSKLAELYRALDWDATDDWTITQSVQVLQEELYSLAAMSYIDRRHASEVINPLDDFRRLEAKIRVGGAVTVDERAAIDIVHLHDDVMYMLGLPVR